MSSPQQQRGQQQEEQQQQATVAHSYGQDGGQEKFAWPIEASYPSQASDDQAIHYPYMPGGGNVCAGPPQGRATREHVTQAILPSSMENLNLTSTTTAFRTGKDASMTMQVEQISGSVPHSQLVDSSPQNYTTDTVGGNAQLNDSSSLETHDQDVEAQMMAEAEDHVKQFLGENFSPIAITVLVANDNNMNPPFKDGVISARDMSRHVGINHDYKGTQNSAQFDAKESSSILKAAFEKFGVMVIPVVNRSKLFLESILKVLAQTSLPKSCDLFWLVFTGHGHSSYVCLNEDLMKFEEIIQAASKISHLQYFAFFFECCQVYGDPIKVSEIEQEYMAVYSCPPSAVSYYYEGVGLMVSCLTEMLEEGYEGSLNELQQELRIRLTKKLPSVFKEPPKNLKEFLNKHLPVHTSTMFHDINLHQKKQSALCPNISVTMMDDKHHAAITVYYSKPLNHHQQYQLKEYIVIATPKNGTAMELLTTKASFSGKSTELSVMLPPQIAPTEGEVVVAAVYGDNGNLRVNSKPYAIEEWPCYGKPKLSCSPAYGGYAVSVDYDANVTLPNHQYYHILETELRLLHNRGDGIRLIPKDGVAILPPSVFPRKCELQLTVKYEGCATPMLSEPYEVIQPALPKPKIVSVDKVDALSVCLKISSNSPDASANSDLYKVTECCVQSRFENSEWVEVDRKRFVGDEIMDSDIVVKQHLSRTRKQCEYQVILSYHCVEVKSNIFSFHTDGLDVPDKVDLVKEMCSQTHVSFSHSVRADSRFHEQLVYKVVEINSLREERELNGRLTTIQGRKSMIVDDYGGRPVSVCVFYKDNPQLGVIYSDSYKGSRCHYCFCGCMRCIPKSWIFGCIVLLLCFLFCAGGLSFLSTRHVNDTRLVAADQIISHEWSIFSYLCNGIYIEEHIIDYSDNNNGLNVTIIEMAREDVTTENIFVPSTAYVGNLKMYPGHRRKLVPKNYYTNPKYLLKASTITLECQFYGVDPGNSIEYAYVHIFDSREDAVNYQSGNRSHKAVHEANVTDCIERVCKFDFTVNRNAFYFPVLTTKADFLLNVTTNFSFNIVRYNHSYSQLNGETVTKDKRLLYHFKKSHLTLLYAHWPNPWYEPKLSHLRFTCSPQKDLIAILIYAACVCFLLFITSTIFSVLICNCCRKQRALEGPNETTPLLSHVT